MGTRRALRALLVTALAAGSLALALAPGCTCGDPEHAARDTGARSRTASRPAPPPESPARRDKRVLPEGTLSAVHGDVVLDARDRRPPPTTTAPGGATAEAAGQADPAAAASEPGEGPGERGPARQGDELYIGDAVITQEGAEATVRTSDGAEVYLGPSTMVVIEPYGTGQILVPRGRARVYLPSTGPRRRPVSVVTAAGIGAIASGDVVVAARADGAVRFEVLTGSVSLDLAVGPTEEPQVLAREPVQVAAGKRLELEQVPAGREVPHPAPVDGAAALQPALQQADEWLATGGGARAEQARALLERAVSEATALFAVNERRRERTVQLHQERGAAVATKRGQVDQVQARIIENAQALHKLNALGRAAWGRVRAALLLAADGTRVELDAGGPGSPFVELSNRARDMFRRPHRGPPGRRGFPSLPLRLDPTQFRPPGPQIPMSDQAETRPR